MYLLMQICRTSSAGLIAVGSESNLFGGYSSSESLSFPLGHMEGKIMMFRANLVDDRMVEDENRVAKIK